MDPADALHTLSSQGTAIGKTQAVYPDRPQQHCHFSTELRFAPLSDADVLPQSLLHTPLVSLTLLVLGNHREQMQLFLIPSSACLVVLSSPWLTPHNPQIDWTSGLLTV